MHTTLPRILLVEDDPVSSHFLATAAAGLPAKVDAVATVQAARRQLQGRHYDLLLVDANLPDGPGTTLLAGLPPEFQGALLAHTAATRRHELDALLEAGFDEVLPKPIPVAALQGALRRALHAPPSRASALQPGGKLPVWDAAAAIAAVNGQDSQALQLRALFLAELASQRESIATRFAAGDAGGLRAGLHRLRGSCGFVGARRLGAAVQDLAQTPASAAALQSFLEAVDDTLAGGAGSVG